MSGKIYIIFSEKWNQFYVGCSVDEVSRLEEHNAGKNKSTRGGAPWEIKFTETFETMTLARKRESEIKRKKSRKYLEWLISSSAG